MQITSSPQSNTTRLITSNWTEPTTNRRIRANPKAKTKKTFTTKKKKILIWNPIIRWRKKKKTRGERWKERKKNLSAGKLCLGATIFFFFFFCYLPNERGGCLNTAGAIEKITSGGSTHNGLMLVFHWGTFFFFLEMGLLINPC